MNFCGGISYTTTKNDDDGRTKTTSVGSDLCHHSHGPITDEDREWLHEALDEWLNKSNGTGSFWLGNSPH